MKTMKAPRFIRSFTEGKCDLDPRCTELHRMIKESNSNYKTVLKNCPKQINCVDLYGRTPIHYLLSNNSIDPIDLNVLRYLVNFPGVNLNIKDINGMTILHHATLTGNIDVVSIIIKSNKCDINSQDLLGNTPIINSSEYIYKDITNLLLSYGADTSLKNNKNKSAADFINENF